MMYPSMQETGEGSGRRAKAQARRSPYPGDARDERYAGWTLEDIDAPEAWTLGSFDDLVPRELA